MLENNKPRMEEPILFKRKVNNNNRVVKDKKSFF